MHLLPCASPACVNLEGWEANLDWLSCSVCRQVTYCSQACMEADAEQHARTCAWYRRHRCVCGASDGLRWCKGCHKVKYCGADCQRADWPGHREACLEAQRAQQQQ